jgi:Lrp/AsnC family transcriptional regulator
MEHDIDETDRRILREMQSDSSRPVTQLAEAVGLSHAPCWRRIQRLRSDGFIAREVAVLDRSKVGFDLEMFVFLKISALGRANIAETRRYVTQHKRVIGAYVLLGNFDLMLHVVARNIRDYETFYFEHLSASTYLSEINSMTVMSRLKDTDLPI